MWRAVTATALAIGVLAGLGAYLAYTVGPDRPPPLAPEPPATPPAVPQGKPEEGALPEGTPGPTRAAAEGPPVPVAATPPAGVSCPSGWLFFDNPALHYSICYPAAWGFTDFSTTSPLSAIPARGLGSVNILSADAFPYPADVPFTERPPEVQARLEQAITVNIESFAPGEAREGCQPVTYD